MCGRCRLWTSSSALSSSLVLDNLFEFKKKKIAVQLQAVDHSAHRSMKNGASSDKQCELQDTANTGFSNAHCGDGVSRRLICLRVGILINSSTGLFVRTFWDLSSSFGLPNGSQRLELKVSTACSSTFCFLLAGNLVAKYPGSVDGSDFVSLPVTEPP